MSATDVSQLCQPVMSASYVSQLCQSVMSATDVSKRCQQVMSASYVSQLCQPVMSAICMRHFKVHKMCCHYHCFQLCLMTLFKEMLLAMVSCHFIPTKVRKGIIKMSMYYTLHILSIDCEKLYSIPQVGTVLDYYTPWPVHSPSVHT